MDIFNGRYFIINKILLSVSGIWPYESYHKKLLCRISFSILMFCIILPQLRVVYESIAQNWKAITDEKEENILIEFSERGRLLTIGYILYMISALVVFTTLPLTPKILDVVIPLNVSRPPIFVLGGEYLFIDRDENYGIIFMFDIVCCMTSAWLICAVDAMYAACTEHCIALFAIIKFRLQIATNHNNEKSDTTKLKYHDTSYDFIVQTIRLHSKILNFTDTLESSYSFSFLFLMGLNMVILSMEIILVLIKLDQILELIRYSFILCGVLIHLFYVSWPGQKVIDYSNSIFQDAYLNEWYAIPTRAQKLLAFMSLRSKKPCQLTAGGIYVMNFENFAGIIKTSLSYMTILASFR